MTISFSTEREREEMDKKIQKYRRWQKKQPEGGGLAFDQWLHQMPGPKEIIPPRKIPEPGPSHPIPPGIDKEF